MRSANDKIGSSAYYAPEVARWNVTLRRDKEDEDTTRKFDENFNTPALDVWSFGVILYELCTGRNLFPQDLNDDSMVLDKDEMRLCLWSCIDDELLSGVFKNCDSCSEERRAQAQHLIRWCLQGKASNRPSFKEILRHPFVQALDAEEDETEIEDAVKTKRVARISQSRPTVNQHFPHCNLLTSTHAISLFYYTHASRGKW